MKKIVKNISQILTGAGAAICLWTGKAISVYAEEAPKTSVEEGAEAARASGMPAELIGDNGVFGRITNVILLIIGIVSVIMLIYNVFNRNIEHVSYYAYLRRSSLHPFRW